MQHRTRQNYSTLIVSAAKVVEKGITRVIGLESKTQQLYQISKLPEDCWEVAVNALLSNGWSKDKTSELVANANEVLQAVPQASDQCREWFDRQMLCKAVLAGRELSATTVKKLHALADATLSSIPDELAGFGDQFWEWAIEHRGGDSWNVRKLTTKLLEMQAQIEELSNAAKASWVHGDWRDTVDTLEDGSIKLLLTDPPYGMGYQSNRRKEKHAEIAADGTLQSATEELVQMLGAVKSKLAADAHVLVFCRWDSEAAFAAMLRSAGLEVKGSLIWVKNNHGSGDLVGGFAPMHERVIHAVKGKPALMVREPDVMQCEKVDTKKHPTEKPVELLTRLIEATTVEGNTVFDPFGGVASTLVAASQCKRKGIGCEIDKDYHQKGRERLGWE